MSTTFKKPNASWLFTIYVDVNNESICEKIVDLEPILYITPGETFGGELFNFELVIQYNIVNENIYWHPCSDWDILFDIVLIDKTGKEFALLVNRNWRGLPANQHLI